MTIFCTSKDIVKSKLSQAIYRCTKGYLVRYARTLSEYWTEIDIKKIVGAIWERAAICLLPLVDIKGIGFVAKIWDSPLAIPVATYGANGFGLVFNSPEYGGDSIVGCVEILIFSETVPNLTDKCLFLFGNSLQFAFILL